MTITKELTNHSLPEIGDAFGGRDHTTVIHACKKVEELKKSDLKVDEDYNNIKRLLTSQKNIKKKTRLTLEPAS